VLHYEKLDVYQVSIQFVAAAVAISEQVPKGCAGRRGDQDAHDHAHAHVARRASC
jgi:hypothetical protein